MYGGWGRPLSLADIIYRRHPLPNNLEVPLFLRLSFILRGLIDFVCFLVFLEHEHGQKVEGALYVCQIDDVDLFTHLVHHLFMVSEKSCVTLT